jgi:methionyl-tRNA synthetase
MYYALLPLVMPKPRLLVTSALPYANGPIHLGHMVEHIQTNIWVRFKRMTGRRVLYVCGDDTHGTSIMIRARQEGRAEEQLIAAVHTEHLRDLDGFGVVFDHYGSTHSPENRSLCNEIWASLRRGGFIAEREIQQLFDIKEGVFLADRFVKGTCPNCGAVDQFGDNCERCGATYTPTDLIDPVSTLSGTRPEVRSALHLFVTIEKLHSFLEEWIRGEGRVDGGIANYLRGHFLSKPLRDWDVSRPAPYFGFEIPDAPGQYWYVWFDAPIGYMAATKVWCERTGERFDDWWRSEDTEIVHFIGKDIVYFHVLFWPAVLQACGFALPSRVQVHGMLTVNGAKMSKRGGTQINPSKYLELLDPAYLRYYFASKLTGKPDDMDLDLGEFVSKVDADLVNKVANLASRTARLVQTLSEPYPEDSGLFSQGVTAGHEIAEAYEACDSARATRLVMELADRANQYVDKMQPWALRKDPARAEELRDVCTIALNLFRQIVVYLAPVVPTLADRTGELFGVPIKSWEDSKTPLVAIELKPFQHLVKRVDPKKVQALLDASAEAAANAGEAAAADSDGTEPLEAEPLAPECAIEDFSKIDLRVARIVAAESVPEADKLLRLTVSLGGGVRRNVFAGIKAHYDPATLVGRLVIVVANLKPRKMRFGVSEGMVVAAGGKGESFLLAPDSGAKPGQRVH